MNELQPLRIFQKILAGCCLGFVALLLSGCTAPIGADWVNARQAYAQVNDNALRSGKPSANTIATLYRFNLDDLANSQPDKAVHQLHQKALETGERNLLFALAEMSYVAGDHIRRSVKPWDPRDARDYYLGSAVYAWLFLFGEGKDTPPSMYDRRFREACEFYNYGLGLALTGRRSSNAVVELVNGPRRLPVGEIELRIEDTPTIRRTNEFEQILLADQFRVHGLSVRNRNAGIGAPLICIGRLNPSLKIYPTSPATMLLRGPASLAELNTGGNKCLLELYSGLDIASVSIGGAQVPLEMDFTAYRAYVLNQSFVWNLGALQFLAPSEQIRSQLIFNQSYTPGRIPVVFVHGTFSSPVTWAEMANSLAGDPEFRSRYQIWSFIYGSGNPLSISAGELRDALTAAVQKLDPEGKNPALHQMVVIGHSQGGLLTKLTATDTGDRLWHVVSTNRLEDLKLSEAQQALIKKYLFLEPLPFVKRVVFISTPHRGSYQIGNFLQTLAKKLVSLPSTFINQSKEFIGLKEKIVLTSEMKSFQGKPTSITSMSPRNPLLQELAKIPLAPGIAGHSIIAVEGKGDLLRSRDGVVSYESAHLDYVESEFIVHSFHSCLDRPDTIEEVRRILRKHLNQLPAGTNSAR